MIGKDLLGKKQFARWGRLLLVTIVVVVTLAACAKPAAPKEEEVVTLKLMYWGDVISTQEVMSNDLIPAFEKEHPNIKIEFESLPWGDYWTKIGALAASDDLPDMYSNSVAYIWDHANKGMAANLQSMFDQDLNEDDYYMELATICRYPYTDGDLYAFPFRWVVGTLFYNKDLFDEAGVDYPTEDWTYDDVLEAAKKLTKDTDGDGDIDQWGFLALNDHVALDAVIKSNGGQVLNDEYNKCMLEEPAALESIQWTVDLIHVHGVSPSPDVAAGFEEGIFASGKVAMMSGGSYLSDDFPGAEFDWDVTMQPKGKVTRVVYGGPDSLSISKNSPYKEEAWEFLKFLISKERQSRGDLIGLGSLPILKGVYETALADAEGLPEHATAFAHSGPYVKGADFGSQWMEWRVTIMNSELQLALLGERSVEESAAAACKAIDEVLDTIEFPE
jgi:multiple sugar transport system substrate-binding protein